MFPDKKTSFIEDFKNISKYWQKVTEPVVKQVSPIAENIIDLGNSRLIYDGCNAGVRIGATGGVLNFYRNKYCQPPSKPVPPGGAGFHVGDVCNCAIDVFFAFYQSGIGGQEKLTGGAGYGQWYFDDPNLPPFGAMVQSPQPESQQPYGLRGIFNNYTEDLLIKRFQPLDTDGNGILLRDGITVFFSIISYEYEEITSNNGYVNPNFPLYFFSKFDPENYSFSTELVPAPWQVVAINCRGCIKNKWIDPPPPPPPSPPPTKNPDEDMDCCRNNDQLLKLILKRIGTTQKVTIFDEDMSRKGTQKADKYPPSLNDFLKLTVDRVEIVNRLLGIDSYPITVPDTMITPYKDGVFGKVFKFIDGNKKRKINSITELIAWMSEQDSAVLGEFHQVIEFQTEDNKTSSIVLPNIAEALKEVVLLTSQMARQNNTQTELLFKLAAEILATKAVATKGTEIAQDIQDYLDYPTQTKTKTIPSTMSMPKLNIDKNGNILGTARTEDHKRFLKPGGMDIIYEDWTGANSLHDQLLDLLQLAAMLRAIYFQRTDK